MTSPSRNKRDKYLIAAFRKVFRWEPVRRETLKAKQIGQKFRCASCCEFFTRKKVVVDHINPVIDVESGWEGWDSYYSRLFCPSSNLQVLCKECHSKKSKEENAARRKAKKSYLHRPE